VALLAAEDVILRSRREYVTFRLASYQAWLNLEQAVGTHVCGERCRASGPAQ
jgi:outer membrane protein TolC